MLIDGGVIKATASRNGAAGIGSGYGSRRSIFNTIGGPSSATVVINGGVIAATGKGSAAGVGAGSNGSTADVTINTDGAGSVKAVGGVSPQPKNSAGESVYLLQVSNPGGDAVIVNGAAWGVNNGAAADGDTDLYIYLPGTTAADVAVGKRAVERYRANTQTGKFEVSTGSVYYDPAAGMTKMCEAAAPVTAETVSWSGDNGMGGWYVVRDTLGVGQVTVSGNVNLILIGGATLTVTGGIQIQNGGHLTVWGQNKNSGNDGVLVVLSGNRTGIGTGRGGSNVKITVNGGTITAASRGVAGVGGGGNGASATVIVNGGVVKANGGVSPQPVNASGKTVYPMQVSNPEGEIVAVDGTVLAVRNHAAADGDTNLYAYVPATNPLVAVGSDRVEQYMLNEQTGRLDKTEGVRYYDPSVGQEQFHDTVKLLTAGQTNWTGDNESGGWYMAAGPLSVGEVFVSGSVNLVLANGSSLTSNGGIHVQSGSSLTIWGQNEDCMQDGTVTAQGDTFDPGIGTAAHISGGAVTINGGVITATGGRRVQRGHRCRRFRELCLVQRHGNHQRRHRDGQR